MLIAEDLLLQLTDAESGKARAESTPLTYALAGALLLELSLDGKVDVAGPNEPVKEGRLVVRDPARTGNPVLDHALGELERRQNKKPRDVIGKLAKGVRADVYGQLETHGAVRREEGTVLGVISRTRWPILDTAARARTQSAIEQLVTRDVGGEDPRTSALVALLSAIDKLPLVVTPDQSGLSKKEIRRRGKQISADSWAPQAVKDAVAAVNAAVTAAVIVAASSAASSGS